MTRDSSERRRETAELRLPTARLTLIRIWSVVGAIVIAATILNVLGVLSPVIEFLAVGSLIAFVESPIVNGLEHRGVPRGLGALIGLIVVIAVIACIVMVVVPMFFEQCLEILSNLPEQLRDFGTLITTALQRFRSFSQGSWALDVDSLFASLANIVQTYGKQIAGDLGKGMFPFISALTSQFFIVFLGLVLAYWLACDYPRIHREISTIVGEEKETSYRFMVAILSRSIGGYMRGMVITSIVGGFLAFVGFVLIGHPYASLMGVLTGIMHLVPVVGPWVSAAAATILAFFINPFLALWTLLVTVIAQNITDNVVSPKVMQSAVQVHPAMSLAALVVGSALMGPLGMVVAIPLCAALKGLFIFYFENDTNRQIVSYDGALFKGTPFVDAEGLPVAAFDALGDDKFASDSEIIKDDFMPDAQAKPRPDLDNPWSALSILQTGPRPSQTGIFRMPRAAESRGADESAQKCDSSRSDNNEDDE